VCCHDVCLLGVNDVRCRLKCCDGVNNCCNGGSMIVFLLALIIIFLRMFILFFFLFCFDHLCD
jgi:hypothetical protein